MDILLTKSVKEQESFDCPPAYFIDWIIINTQYWHLYQYKPLQPQTDEAQAKSFGYKVIIAY
jgi:hypothetical protein